MTTNQTIDGVPRGIVERITNPFGDPHDKFNAVQELRALLDAPACKKCGGSGWVPEPFSIRENVLKCPDCKPAAQPQGEPVAFQVRVKPWMLECFGEVIAADRQERNHRFLEEALELVQSNQCTAREAHQLVDYVYGRPVGDTAQEVGGVMVTLAALCLAAGLDMHAAGETELARIWTKVEQIRAKQAAKPAMSPLPGAYPDREQPAPVAVVIPEKYDDVLLPFLSLMRAELHANAHKGDRPGWLQMDRKTAILEVFYHMGKLHQAVHRSDSAAIKEYAADVANMCMMLLDVCDCLDEATRRNTK